jgi:cobalt-zinc-cadmium efflux system outer membrane protein
LQAEAAMVDAERAYAVITRLDVRPVTAHTETLTSQEDIDDTHPRLQYLRSGVDLALANVRQSENSVKGNPTLTIGTRREQPDRSTAPVSSLGIQLSIPFGGGSYVSAQTSAARRARVDAEVEYLNTYTQLNQALHEVEHDLFISEQEEPLRRTQAELNRERFNMALAAYEVGETTLVQVVMAQQQAQESDHALQSLLRERERLITEFNQLIGVMP